VLHRGLGQEEIRKDVGAKCPLKLLRGDFFDRILRMLLGRIINKDVDSAEFAQC
jgi:hypothetical protein